MIDVGWLGSPVDAATFVVVFVAIVKDLRPRLEDNEAATVANARHTPGVDADHVQKDLDVVDRDADAYEVATDGGPNGSR